MSSNQDNIHHAIIESDYETNSFLLSFLIGEHPATVFVRIKNENEVFVTTEERLIPTEWKGLIAFPLVKRTIYALEQVTIERNKNGLFSQDKIGQYSEIVKHIPVFPKPKAVHEVSHLIYGALVKALNSAFKDPQIFLMVFSQEIKICNNSIDHNNKEIEKAEAMLVALKKTNEALLARKNAIQTNGMKYMRTHNLLNKEVEEPQQLELAATGS